MSSSLESPTSARTVLLASGWFWGPEAVYDRAEGVLDDESGYFNGLAHRPSYEQYEAGWRRCVLLRSQESAQPRCADLAHPEGPACAALRIEVKGS